MKDKKMSLSERLDKTQKDYARLMESLSQNAPILACLQTKRRVLEERLEVLERELVEKQSD